MPQVDILTILAIFIAIGAVYVIGMLLVLPIRLIMKLVVNGIVGAVALFIVNIFGSYAGINIGINPATALIAGFLGVPGVIVLIFLRIIL